METLRASLAAAEHGGSGSGSNGSSDGDPVRLSKDELYDLAKAADIRGRADMSKDELVAALRAAA